MQFLLCYFVIAPLVILWTVVMGVISLVMSLFGAGENKLHEIARTWARAFLRMSFVKCDVEGIEKLDPSRNYVLVSNHASYFDTPVIIATIPLQFRFFAKHGLFQIPLLGTHLGRAGHFPVIRGNPRAGLKSMADGAKAIAQRNVSVLLFPEGGRSPHHLREFKEGAAYIAIKAGVPVVPVGIVGTREILPMHSMRVRPGPAKLLIGDPIETSNLSVQDRDGLTATLHEKVAEMIGEVATQAA